MGKSTKSKKAADCTGKGKVTPVQIAFMVDRYLLDNGYTNTRSAFRNEASSLIAKSPVQQAPRTLLSLGAILNEYITLKEQKVWMDLERRRLEQEKLRVRSLLSGMQEVMNAYNASGNDVLSPPPSMSVAASKTLHSQNDLAAGHGPTYNSPNIMPVSRPSSVLSDSNNFSTPAPCNVPSKRRASNNVSENNVAPKKSRTPALPKDVNSFARSLNSEKNPVISVMDSAVRSSACVADANASSVQGSNVVKCLFNPKPPSPHSNSPVPKTPLRVSSQTKKSTSPLANSSTAAFCEGATSQQIITANRTIISSETIRVSPNKRISYYSIEKNHISACSPAKSMTLERPERKGQVKGRLDFGASETTTMTENTSPDSNDTPGSDQGGDFLELDLPNLDALSLDFNLSEFLLDLDMQNEELCSPSHQVLGSAPDSTPWSLSGNVLIDGGQVLSQNSSSVAGFLGDTDISSMGPESVAAVRSITKCITILSPVKNQQGQLSQETLSVINRLNTYHRGEEYFLKLTCHAQLPPKYFHSFRLPELIYSFLNALRRCIIILTTDSFVTLNF